MSRQRLLSRVLVTLLCLVIPQWQALAADDNLLAYKLYQQGDYTQAGEIFTDPAWKGMALYRSAQWWRAAEAFLRADDALSAYNLGNCYAQLGYFALALDAYQRALSLNPALDNAEHNARIMRQILTSEGDQQQQGGRQAKGEEIGRLDTDSQEDGGGSSSDTGEQDSANSEQSAGESGEADDQQLSSTEQAQAGTRGDSSEKTDKRQPPEGNDGSTASGSPTDEPNESGKPSGGADTDEPTTESASAGMRTDLENAQATTQWLNRIQNDAQLFLQKRLKLEQQRRLSAGQTPPGGGSTW